MWKRVNYNLKLQAQNKNKLYNASQCPKDKSKCQKKAESGYKI